MRPWGEVEQSRVRHRGRRRYAGNGENSPGIITTGNLTLRAGSTFAAELNGATPGTEADQVVVNGDADMTGATLATTGTIASFPGQVVTLSSFRFFL